MTSNSVNPLTIVHGFRAETKKFASSKKDIIGKGISRGAEWHKFQLRSSFQRGVMSEKRNLTKTPDYV